MTQNKEGVVDETSSSFLSNLILAVVDNPTIWILIIVGLLFIYIIFSWLKPDSDDVSHNSPQLPPIKKRDMTYQELKTYDGLNDKRQVCVAVNGKIFDVTGIKRFGPGGPYAAFAGKDATRCLATFSIEGARDEYDDLFDLNSVQMDKVREWEAQFGDNYPYVGRLLKPGEEPTDYSDEDEPSQDQSTFESQSSPSSSKKDE